MSDGGWVESGEIEICAGAALPRIPPGEYTIRWGTSRILTYGGRYKLAVSCEIVDGPYKGTILEKFFYLATDPNGRRKAIIGRRSELFRQLRNANPDREPDEVAIRQMHGRYFIARVETVVENFRREPLGYEDQYSVVRVLGNEVGF